MFELKHLYRVEFAPDNGQQALFQVRTTFYHYDILDREGQEVVVYHWEPDGISPIRRPHLHLTAATPVVLPQRSDSTQRGQRNRLHLLTGRVTVEYVVEVLIREFQVVPLRADWELVLAMGRSDEDTLGDA